MGEDAWYFGGDELLLISSKDEILGYDSLNIQGHGCEADDDDE